MNNEVAKSPIVIEDNVSGSVNDILTPDCSSLEELENFIDRSFKSVGCLPPKNNNIFLAQSKSQLIALPLLDHHLTLSRELWKNVLKYLKRRWNQDFHI